MKNLFILFAISLGSFSCGTDKNTEITSSEISGKVFDSEGRNVSQATIIVRSSAMGRDTVALGTLAKDGSYEIKLENRGIFFIEFASPFHTPYFVEIVALELGTKHSIDAHLAPYKYISGNDTIKIVLMGENPREEILNLGGDGIYRAKFTNDSDTLKYELSGHIETKVGRTTNGTDHDFMEYDGGGDWASVIIGRKGEIEISFDPSKFQRKYEEAHITNLDPATASNKELKTKCDTINNIYARKMNATRSGKGDMDEAKSLQGETAKAIEELWKNEKSESNKFYLAYRYFNIASNGYSFKKPEFLSKDISAYLLRKLSPNSELWEMNKLSWSAATIAIFNDMDIYDNPFIDSLEIHNKVAAERYHYYRVYYTFSIGKDTSKARELFAEMKEKYPNSKHLKSLGFELKKDKNIAYRKQAPDFKLASLDNPKETISLASYKGKYLFIDFWAVWCGPCIGEMPHLHKAHKKYSGKNFAMLSLSFDRNADDVTQYRAKGKHPMPWDHIFIEGGFDANISIEYEVRGIPKPILLDPDGIIIAFGSELRGDNLEETLSKYLSQ